jgi:hypothetical protein
MFQSGDVDYLVATDAVGMGLNLDVDHVAFASDRKYDGYQFRRLNPSEFAQIAGRAGRATRDGTFGTTGRCAPFEPELVNALQNHTFDSVKMLQWRNSKLDFTSLGALQVSLALTPQHEVQTLPPSFMGTSTPSRETATVWAGFGIVSSDLRRRSKLLRSCSSRADSALGSRSRLDFDGFIAPNLPNIVSLSWGVRCATAQAARCAGQRRTAALHAVVRLGVPRVVRGPKKNGTRRCRFSWRNLREGQLPSCTGGGGAAAAGFSTVSTLTRPRRSPM